MAAAAPTHHGLTGANNVDTDADARMPDARTGHRTPDTGHRTRAPGTGHWTPDERTPDARTLDTHRTPDTGRADAGHADADEGRGQGNQATVGIRISWHHDAAGTANRVAVAAPAALGSHDGSAVRPPASARDCLHCQAAARSLRRRPSGASAHCSPRTITGGE
jgi:hypothetical protein